MYFDYIIIYIIIQTCLKELTQTKTIEGGFKLDQTLKEKILLIQKNKSIAYVNFLNNGTVTKDEYSQSERLSRVNSPYYVDAIKEIFCDAAECIVYKFDFNNLNMDLLIGLVYKVEDIDENDKIKEGAKPINNVARFYTGDITTYLDDKEAYRIKTGDNYSFRWTRDSYINYNEFVSLLEKNGMNYNGPKSFKELKEAILSGETFDIDVSIDLREKTQDKKLIKRR